MVPVSCDSQANGVPSSEQIDQCNVIENINFDVIPVQQSNIDDAVAQ